MSILTIKRNFNGVENYVQIDCTDTLEEITTSGFLIDPIINDSIIVANSGEFDFLTNDFILITYVGGLGIFNYDISNHCFIPVVPGLSNFTYEPTISFQTPGNSTFSYTRRLGTYYIIGKMVFLNFDIAFTPTFTTASGNIEITIPRTSLRVVAFGLNDIGTNTAYPAGATQLTPIIFSGATQANIRAMGTNFETLLGTTTYTSGVSRTITAGLTYIMR